VTTAAFVSPDAIPKSARPFETLDLDDPRWLTFIESQPEVTPFHHPSWARLLTECYGFPSFAVAALDGGEVVAGLPMLELAGPLRQRRWACLPFTDFCPPLVGTCDSLDLVQGLERLRDQSRVSGVELRSPIDAPALHAERVGYRHLLALDRDCDRVLATFGKSRVQQPIRQAERFVASGRVAIRRAESESDLTKDFYGVHVATRRRLGVPVQPRRFFRLLWQRMIEPGLGYALLAYSAGMPIGGAVFLGYGKTMVYKFGASDRDAQRLRPNHLLLWSAIREGCERGFETFDFGRTDLDGDGLREYKLGWGTKEEPLVYTRLGAQAAHRGTGRSAAVLGAVIRHSPPAVCRAIGELLYKHAA
jgi:CelD/BcsL family acetyltransferase involved in cellulose biosynthesis